MFQVKTGDSSSASFSESLVLDDSGEGVVITGITDDTIAAKSGLQAGDEIVAATIHLDHLKKNEVLNILKVLEPYEDNVKVLTKKDLTTNAGLGSLGLGLRDSPEMLLEKDLSLNASAETPDVSLDGLSGNLNAAKGMGGKIKGPTLNGDLPSLSLDNYSADTGANFAVSPAGPDIKTGLGGTLTAPNVNVSAPQLNTPSASLDIDKPEIKTGNLKYKPPKFKMPHFNLPQFQTPKADMDVSGDVDLPSVSGNIETPNLNLSAPKADLECPDLELNGPKLDLNGSGVKLDTPNAEIETTSHKINWPHLKWKGPKVKAPHADMNADLSTADASISTPKIDGNLSTPDFDVNLPTTEITSPDLDVQTPDLDIDARSGKINWPHKKWKKPKFQGPKADLDVDADLDTPDFSASKIEGDINVPNAELNLLNADLRGPDVNTTDVNIDAPSGRFNWPHLKWRKSKLHTPKADVDWNADLSAPDVDLSASKIDGGIKTPDIDVNLPKASADVKAPDADVELHSSKIKFPTLKKNKFLLSGTKVKAPDVDVDADVAAPDLKVSSPDAPGIHLTTPNVDTEAPSGKFKWFSAKRPKWSVSGPKVGETDIDLDADVSGPDMNLSAPKIDGEINLPQAELGRAIDSPDVDIEGHTGKFKWLNFKKPKIGTLKGPKADIDADVKAPGLDLKGPDVDVRAADVNLSAPEIAGGIDSPDLNISMPNADVKGPDVDLKSPDLNLDPPDGKIKLPKFKLPKFRGPNAKGPELDANFTAPDIDTSLDLPEVDLDRQNVALEAPDLSLSAPKIKGGLDATDLDINLPNADLKGPDVDLKSPDLNLDPPDGKIKLPKFKLPKFKLPNAKGPELDANFTAPDIDTSLDLPEVDLGRQNVALEAPDLSLSAPKIKGGLDATDLDINLPNADIKGPDLPKADLQLPNLNMNASDLSLSSPKIDGNVSVPNIDTKLPKAELEVPNITGKSTDVADLKGPNAQLKTPDLDLEPHLGDFKMPHFKLPKLDLSSPEVEVPTALPSVEAGIETPRVNIGTPTADANISVAPVDLSGSKLKGDIEGPKADVKVPNVDTNLEKPKFPHFKFPKFNLGSKMRSSDDETDVNLEEGSGADSETDTEMEVPAFKFHRLPRNSVDGIGEIADAFGLTKSDTDEKDYVISKGIRLPIVNATSKAGEKIDIMERLKMAREKAPSANVPPTEEKTDIGLKFNTPSLDVGGSTETGDPSLVRVDTFKVEKPESELGLGAPEISTSDENDKMSLSLSNMLGLNIKN
ncbi:neuroblast differentiation-associated protein AHNAK [Amphiprion ocellaris]|uniref:neuroblast differentiation-associated protein AHNAK n=1 Tax=Amphiprion ocellaris TaxID=80972 RepID=UPI00241153E9|nr:neuroblast differentiation-associated protein AHNAK [Amphiprion ocellaris]